MNTALTCAQVQSLLPLILNGSLVAGERAAIDTHLATCAACRNELALWRMLPGALATLEGDHALGSTVADAWARLESHLLATTPDDPTVPEWSGAAIALADASRPLTTPHPDAHPRRPSRANTLSALLTVLLVVAISGALFSYLHGALATTRGGVSGSATPVQLGFHPTHLMSVRELLPNVIFYDVQMLSADDGWAVGGTNVIVGNNSTYNTAIYHFQRGRWSASPDVVASSLLLSVSMVAPDDGWAAGETTHDSTTNIDETALMLHYDGQHWRQVAIPPHDQLNKVTMLSATEGWALANDLNTFFPLLHYQHGVWSDVNRTQPAFYTALSMTSPSEGWAAGYAGVMGHFLNGTWTDWPTTAPGDVDALAMRSATDGWAIAGSPDNYTGKRYQQLTVLHWDGATWNANPLASASASFSPIITGITFSGSTGLLAGKIENEAGTTQGSVLFRYANGAWNLDSFEVNAALSAVSLASPTEGWAVGYKMRLQTSPSGSGGTVVDGVLLHFLNGQWTVYQP